MHLPAWPRQRQVHRRPHGAAGRPHGEGGTGGGARVARQAPALGDLCRGQHAGGAHPYLVTERSDAVRQLQNSSHDQHGVWFPTTLKPSRSIASATPPIRGPSTRLSSMWSASVPRSPIAGGVSQSRAAPGVQELRDSGNASSRPTAFMGQRSPAVLSRSGDGWPVIIEADRGGRHARSERERDALASLRTVALERLYHEGGKYRNEPTSNR